MFFCLETKEPKIQEGFEEIFALRQNRGCRLPLHALFRLGETHFRWRHHYL